MSLYSRVFEKQGSRSNGGSSSSPEQHPRVVPASMSISNASRRRLQQHPPQRAVPNQQYRPQQQRQPPRQSSPTRPQGGRGAIEANTILNIGSGKISIRLVERMGRGAFGEVWRGVRVDGAHRSIPLAIKLERLDKIDPNTGEVIRSRRPQIKQEYDLYKELQSISKHSQFGNIGLPKAHFYTFWQGRHVMALDLLGDSVHRRMQLLRTRTTLAQIRRTVEFITLPERNMNANIAPLPLRFVMNAAVQMLNVLEDVHDMQIIHRDIKPGNFLLGHVSARDYDGTIVPKHDERVYLVDFGLARRWKEGDTYEPDHQYLVVEESHTRTQTTNNRGDNNNKSSDTSTDNSMSKPDDVDILEKLDVQNVGKMRKKGGFVGTAVYCSRRAHCGIKIGRRDDLESLLYVLVHMSLASLPWSYIKHPEKKVRSEMIYHAKMASTPETVCEGLPEVFQHVLEKIYAMDPAARPDYALYRRMFEEAEAHIFAPKHTHTHKKSKKEKKSGKSKKDDNIKDESDESSTPAKKHKKSKKSKKNASNTGNGTNAKKSKHKSKHAKEHSSSQ